MSELLWRVSGYDGKVHAFTELGASFSEALCSHSIPTGHLSDPDGRHALRCVVCLLVFGGDLVAKRGDPGGWRD
jgi:hypothetical protein